MLSTSSSWSGMLPPPDDFAKYPQAVQERMMRWNDAWTTDESARQDKLVDAQVQQAAKGPRRALIVVLTAFALAAVSQWVFQSTVLAVAFLGAPILLFASNLIQGVTSRSSKTPPAEESGEKEP